MDKLDMNGKQWSLGSLEQEVSAQIKKHNKERKHIKDSSEPRLNIPAQRDYELNQLRTIFDKNIKAIESEYQELGKELIEEEETKVKRENLVPNQAIKDKVQSLFDEANFYYFTATDHLGKQAAISDLANKVDELNEYEKSHARTKIAGLMQQVEGDTLTVRSSVRSIAMSLKDVQTEGEATLEQLKAEVASGPSVEYRNMVIAEQAGETSRKRWQSQGDTLTDLTLETEYKDI